MDKKFINHLVRGYFDGDGCFSWKNKQQAKWQPQITIVGTKDFLNGINKVANINYKICKSKSSNAYNIYISGTKVVQSFTNWLYKDATIFLERKRKI